MFESNYDRIEKALLNYMFCALDQSKLNYHRMYIRIHNYENKIRAAVEEKENRTTTCNLSFFIR